MPLFIFHDFVHILKKNCFCYDLQFDRLFQKSSQIVVQGCLLPHLSRDSTESVHAEPHSTVNLEQLMAHTLSHWKHFLFLYCFIHTLVIGVCCSLSQLSRARGGTPWIGHQHITGLTQQQTTIHTHTHILRESMSGVIYNNFQ